MISLRTCASLGWEVVVDLCFGVMKLSIHPNVATDLRMFILKALLLGYIAVSMCFGTGEVATMTDWRVEVWHRNSHNRAGNNPDNGIQMAGAHP